MSERSIDSVFHTRSIIAKEAGTPFYTPKKNSNNKQRKGIKPFFSSLHIDKPSLRKLSSLYLIITVLFQSMAGLFLFVPQTYASYNDSWYDNNYSYRKPITIDKTKIPHTDTNNTNQYLTDFPVLISLTDNDLKSAANNGKVQKEDGSDIIFTLPDKTLLNYEIESYDKTTGSLVAWVKVPQLYDINSSSNTVIYMYYGNSSAIGNTTVNAQGVWDSNFKMVQHLNGTATGTAGDYKDSTINANSSTNTTNEPTKATGKIGDGQSFDGSSSYIDVGNKNSLNITDEITVGLWMKPNWAGTINTDSYPAWKNLSWRIFDEWGERTYAPGLYIDGSWRSNPTSTLPQSQWSYVTFTYSSNSKTTSRYVNGVLTGATILDGLSNYKISLSSNPVVLGYFLGGKQTDLDEVRISSTARSSDWIKTEYNNQSDPSSFYIIGTEENNYSPLLAEITPISSSTDDSTPSYTFSSSKQGTISYEGDCSSSTTTASIGNNTITFNLLSAGLHNNCTLKVTDGLGNISNSLTISPFTVNTKLTTYIVPAITDNKILPKSNMDSFYIGDTISAQASPGEYKSLSFVVNSNVNIDSFQVEASNLHSLSGKTIPASSVDIKAVKVWYQGNYVSGNYAVDYTVNGRYLTPELLLKDDSLVDVDGDDWNQYNVSNPNGKNYLKVNGVYADISDGTQTNGNPIVTSISSRPIRDASTLQPINLPAEYNKQFWITLNIPDDAVAGNYDGDIILKNSSDTIKNLNLDLKVLPINLLEPNVEYSAYYLGKIKDDGSISSQDKTIEQYVAEMKDMREHGIISSTIYPFGTDDNLIQELSIRQQAGMNNANLYSVWAIANAGDIPYYKNLTASYGVKNIYIYGPDETDLNDSIHRTAIDNVHNAGGKYMDAQSYSQADSVADVLDLAVVSFSPSTQLAAKYHSYGHKIYSYVNPQVVPEYPGTFRKNYGLSLWQADYDGVMDYAYQHSYGDIWNDFDYNIYRDHVFAYPTANGVIDTIQWEGLREGINDMRYMATLQNAISVAKGKGTNTTATEAENYLVTLKSSNLINQDLDVIRSKMIEYILVLQSSSYYLTVNYGDTAGFYPRDSRVTVSADAASSMVFDKWTGDTQYLSDIYSANATLIMPSHAITLTATYKNDAPWYDANYLYRKSITIDHNKVANTDQTNFPVLVSLTDDNLKDTSHGGKVQNSNGNDIIFTLSDKTLLNYEIESYDSSTGKLIAWVKVPSLSHARNTAISLYYGNSSATAQQNKTAVWDSNFKGIWHLGEVATSTAGDFKDSTSNANNSINTANEPTKAEGKIGDGQSFNGSSSYIDVGNKNSLNITDEITVGLWMKPNWAGTINTDSYPAWKNLSWRIWDKYGERAYSPGLYIDGSWRSTSITLPQSQWNYAVFTYSSNSKTIRTYINGLLAETIILNGLSNYEISSSNYPVVFGYFVGNKQTDLDEVRISSTARSSDWIKTEYNNQSDPSSFYTVSAQEGYMDHISITGDNMQEPSKTQTITLTAYTINGNIDTAYTGEKNITLKGASKENNLSPIFTDKNNNNINFNTYAPITFQSGIAHTNITLYKQESANIYATDGYTNTTPIFTILVPGSPVILPSKPSVSDISISTTNNTLNLTNLPNTVKQIAVSLTNDFLHASWQAIDNIQDILKSYANTDTLYIKLRTDTGAVSDTITYTPQDSNNPQNTDIPLQDGDIVKTPSSPDIYVIKLANSKKYKRLILSPQVFNSYHHLKWDNIKTIPEEQLNQYQTSNLVKELNDTIIYTLTPNGDQGQRKPFDLTQTYDPDSIYTINKVDRDSYEWEE